jgi:hypothetical protein
MLTNGVGDQSPDSTGSQFTLLAAQGINAISSDASTGGTVTYFATAKITEFDA